MRSIRDSIFSPSCFFIHYFTVRFEPSVSSEWERDGKEYFTFTSYTLVNLAEDALGHQMWTVFINCRLSYNESESEERIGANNLKSRWMLMHYYWPRDFILSISRSCYVSLFRTHLHIVYACNVRQFNFNESTCLPPVIQLISMNEWSPC